MVDIQNCSGFKVAVPGTTANLGVGFDCLGAAVNRHLQIEVRLESATSSNGSFALLDYVQDLDCIQLKYEDESYPSELSVAVDESPLQVISADRCCSSSTSNVSDENGSDDLTPQAARRKQACDVLASPLREYLRKPQTTTNNSIMRSLKLALQSEKLTRDSKIRTQENVNEGMNETTVNGCICVHRQISLRKIQSMTVQGNLHSGVGMGSSAAAIVGGILVGYVMLGLDLACEMHFEAIRELIVQIEGHADNVVPCLMGGLVLTVPLCTDTGRLSVTRIEWPKWLHFVFVYPDEALNGPSDSSKTKVARAKLPPAFSTSQIVWNMSRVGALVALLKDLRDKEEEIFTAELQNHLALMLEDRLHQPYRTEDNVIFQKLKTYQPTGHALPVFLSGAGPTVVVLQPASQIDKIATDVSNLFGITAHVQVLEIESSGGSVVYF